LRHLFLLLQPFNKF